MNDTTPDNTQILKAVIVVACVAGYFGMGFLPSFGLKPADPGVVQTTQNIMMAIVGFFFGSSVGSAKKDQVIADQAKK